jgi:glutathione S-transferase
MTDLLANPAFETYAFCSAILAIKMLYSGVWAGTRRSKHQGFVNAEDAEVFGPPGATVVAIEPPEVAHALRIQRNDAENIPIFFAIGLLYVLTGAGPWGAWLLCWTYTLARIAHTYCYQNHLQPGRAVSFITGSVAVVLMIVCILWRTL